MTTAGVFLVADVHSSLTLAKIVMDCIFCRYFYEELQSYVCLLVTMIVHGYGLVIHLPNMACVIFVEQRSSKGHVFFGGDE